MNNRDEDTSARLPDVTAMGESVSKSVLSAVSVLEVDMLCP